jgi:hypothetical protein
MFWTRTFSRISAPEEGAGFCNFFPVVDVWNGHGFPEQGT